MNAVASCGLQLYRFGETVSIPYWLDDWRPDSWYDSWPDLKPPAVGHQQFVQFFLQDESRELGTFLDLGQNHEEQESRPSYIVLAWHQSQGADSSLEAVLKGAEERCCKDCSIWTQSLLSSPSAKCVYIYIHISFFNEQTLSKTFAGFTGSPFHHPLNAWRQVENLMRGRKIYEPPRFMTVTRMSQAHGVNLLSKNDWPSTCKGLDASDLFGQVTGGFFFKDVPNLKCQLSYQVLAQVKQALDQLCKVEEVRRCFSPPSVALFL